MSLAIKKEKRYRRHKRVKSKVRGTSNIPRLCVFRSNRHIYAQLIDDEKGITILSEKDLDKKGKTKTEVAYEVGKSLAGKAIKKKIEKVVFDRAGYKYHGRVKSLAEGARQGGLKF